MPLFDAYLMVDWSAASRKVTGKNSIWWALVRQGPDGQPILDGRQNPPTRAAATDDLARRLASLSAAGKRVLVGFDFPFGYPVGTAARLGGETGDWRTVWDRLVAAIEDSDDNINNRFEVAEALNGRLSGDAFPFWGAPVSRGDRRLLLRRAKGPQGRRPHGPADPAERRLCERRTRRTQPTWKLIGAGAVGSQALVGIPRVRQLRLHPDLAAHCLIWPFETALTAPRPTAGDIILAEIYPSLVETAPESGQVKDACQVRSIAAHFAAADARDALGPLFAGDPALDRTERTTVEREEGWILGVTEPTAAPRKRRH